ncbi:MAG: DUF3429 family protein [Proteobacteria bacterium]|nr:DUF3429 family protein [Pseudomonadota bacterium]MDA0995629.1 DUF3429 family protein [Pseudomonadota bacterium]
MNLNKNILSLSYLGLIPFYFFSIISIFEDYNFFIDIFFLYSVIIICFLSGSLWMKLMILPKQKNNAFFRILSVTFPLMAMISELFVSYSLKVIIYVLIYILIYICDKKTAAHQMPEYIRMRFFLTGNVILTHLILLYTIFTYGIF